MLDQRRRRWADVVQMLYKCFVLCLLGCKIIATRTHASECVKYTYACTILFNVYINLANLSNQSINSVTSIAPKSSGDTSSEAQNPNQNQLNLESQIILLKSK